MSGARATVLLPTTGDRGPLLRRSVASVLAQTVDDLELFVVGDGVDPATRSVIEELVASDPRVRFDDHPKHDRRGEPNRHELLRDQASGRIVAYLCDRDLWLPTHLEELERTLADADFAHTLRFHVDDDDGFRSTHASEIAGRDRRSSASWPNLVPLSFAGHTLDAYRRLPHGWRTTPAGWATDRYMWEQFLEQPWVRVAQSAVPTVLYFRRGDHPGLSTPERLALLERWAPRIATRAGSDEVQRAVLLALWQAWRDDEVREQTRRSKPWRAVPRSLRRRLAGR